MKIGQICLAAPSDDSGEKFAMLVETLAELDIKQHVLVGSVSLARRLASCRNVTVGPVVKTPVMAYCLMPDVDVAHIHEVKSGQAGLLLTLTRSIPFIINSNGGEQSSKNPLTRSVIHRASLVITTAEDQPIQRTAAEFLRVYQDAMDSWQRSAMMM